MTAGLPVPSPILARALIDTGSDATGVAASLLLRLGLKKVAQQTTKTISGPLFVDLYEVSISIPGLTAASGPLLVLPQLVVMELSQSLPNIDVLIGLDVLMQCVLHVDGPNRQFAISA